MKKNLLLMASLMIGVSVSAQFSETNSPVIGDSQSLFLLDSSAVAYEAVTGANATWDYSSLTGYSGETRSVSVVDPSTTVSASSFTTSTKALDLEGLLLTYLTDNANGQKCQGFYMNEPTAGIITATFNTDEQELYNYPMDLNGSFSDHYEGTFDLDNSMLGQVTGTVAGDVTVTIDGEGDLQLTAGTYNNVLRYKLEDQFVLSFTPTFPPTPMQITVTRVQYEYYDFTVSDLPIFLHSNLQVDPPAPLQATDQTVVLGLDDPTDPLGLNSNDLDQALVYPNPADKKLNIQLASSMKSANITVTDALGRQVYAKELHSTMNTIDVSQFNKGVYFVKIKDALQSTTKRVIIK